MLLRCYKTNKLRMAGEWYWVSIARYCARLGAVQVGQHLVCVVVTIRGGASRTQIYTVSRLIQCVGACLRISWKGCCNRVRRRRSIGVEQPNEPKAESTTCTADEAKHDACGTDKQRGLRREAVEAGSPEVRILILIGEANSDAQGRARWIPGWFSSQNARLGWGGTAQLR